MGARHGWWCNSKTIPITCKYCGDGIFWFSCDCGSSKLFDELGEPWPIHNCVGYARSSYYFPYRKKKKKRDKYGMRKKDWKRVTYFITKEVAKQLLKKATLKKRKKLRKEWRKRWKRLRKLEEIPF